MPAGQDATIPECRRAAVSEWRLLRFPLIAESPPSRGLESSDENQGNTGGKNRKQRE
jgi:hypothetical protein